MAVAHGTADAAADLDLLGRDGADDGPSSPMTTWRPAMSPRTSRVDLHAVLGDDGDLLAEDGEVCSDHGLTHGGVRERRRASAASGGAA